MGWAEFMDAAKFKETLDLLQFRFNEQMVPRHELLELARIIYSTRKKRTKPAAKQPNAEAISSIIPRVMQKIERLKNEKPN